MFWFTIVLMKQKYSKWIQKSFWIFFKFLAKNRRTIVKMLNFTALKLLCSISKNYLCTENGRTIIQPTLDCGREIERGRGRANDLFMRLLWQLIVKWWKDLFPLTKAEVLNLFLYSRFIIIFTDNLF